MPWAQVTASCHQSAPTHCVLAPVGAASSVPWAQAHADQAALALAASRWLTKEDNSYRAATGGAFDGMDSRAARSNKLCWQTVRSPPGAPASAGPWACAHGIQDVAPIGAEEP